MGKQKIDNDASESIKGIIYQFYVALRCCFELAEGELVLIEKDGDVSTSSTQIEVKEYTDDLTDSHINFWKTLNNWLKDSFDHSKYKTLVLYTTQDYGKYTKFRNWNFLSVTDKDRILRDILINAEGRHATALQKAAEKSETKEKSEVHLLMERVLQVSPSKLNQVLEKFVIADNSELELEHYQRTKDQYLKHIPKCNQDTVMSTMLGLLISPTTIENSWQITYDSFVTQFEDVSRQYISYTMIFPKKHLNPLLKEEEKNSHLNDNFVKKIIDIEYDEVVVGAITDFTTAKRTIEDELKGRTANKKIYDSYNQEIVKLIEPRFRKACRSVVRENLIKQSKDFYDDVMSMESPILGNYSDTHITFKNGTIHMLANDSDIIIWKLKIEDEQDNR